MFLVLVAGYLRSVSFFLGQEKVAYCQSGTIALLSHKPMTGPQESTPESRFESFDQVILFQIEIMYGYL